ncbi:putative barnase/colicin E5 family endoribonuclease, partial [Helicobacter pylori]|uniref:putative barnase/colicin E5 family endoribonuclease n=2 Tax=Helicobacter pylori TaxID=210 RepID=UPI001C62C91D
MPKALNEATAGAALKYHIKRALERSHSVSDFSKQLELSAKNAKFSNNTLKIIEELNNGVKQASDELSKKASDLQHAITPLKEFGTNYPEFALKPKEALEKLLQEKNGQVAGAAYRDDLGGIDFVWGTPKTKDSVGYGLAHIIERREQKALSDGLSEAEAKEYALNIVKSIPEVLEKGSKGTDHLGRVFVDYGNKRVGLNNTWNNKELENHWVISSYELRDTTEKPTHFPTSQAITKEKGIHSLNSNENPTTNSATNQAPLSPLELANAEKLAKLESEKLESEKEFLKAKEQETKRKAALKKKLEHERGNAGNIESQTKIEVGEDIPAQALKEIPKSRVRLNEREIYDLDYAIVKAKDLKPSFTTGGTQKRTDMNEEQIKSISNNFDPKKIFGSGGFEDLPIILHDGQVIAGNHRIAGMLNFTPKSRYIYEKAIKEYYHIDLKPDELLVRLPSKRLNNTEINNLAASSNQGRFNSESDHAIAVLSHYEAKLKELDQKLDADSIYSLKNIVAKNLNFDKATHPNVGDSNLALLMFNMPRTKTQGIELLNRWQKEFSNDIKSYEKVKKMFVDNAGSFHNLIHDMNFPHVSLNAYLSDIMDRSFANLKNYQTTSESLKDLSEKFYKTSSLEMFEKSDQTTSDISEILGSAIARFARFDDPSKALFEALRSDNIKKGLKDFKIADVTKDMFNPDSKEFKDIDIY